MDRRFFFLLYLSIVAAFALTNLKTKQQYTEILNTFAERFLKEKKDPNQALICYLLSDNYAGIIKVFVIYLDFKLANRIRTGPKKKKADFN